ncbi:MAG: class I SAM-dependent methyltransferase [Leptospiraceae bacterium]|nr:class I SAM-dependent methyltransferase [Leptospiraceae bacterium]MCP5513796.1 class I SAM-dependent methyltransferase [Leptospiraceae bacterium]
MNSNCYICGSKKNKEVFREHEIPILKCLDCGHAFSSFEQAEHYDGYWGDEGESFDLDWWDLAHREIYSEFIQKFLHSETGKILDVGCGLGFFVKMVSEKRPGWHAIGYEMSSKAVHFAKQTNGLIHVHEGIVQESGIEENSIDVITLWDVIEHIPKPHSLLEYLYTILKPGGFLFLQTPNFPIQLYKARLKKLLKGMKEGVHYLEARDHINDYNRASLKRLLLDCQFEEPSFTILKPILSVSGSKSNLGKLGKIGFYYATNLIWKLSLETLMLNNTLFAVAKKKTN